MQTTSLQQNLAAALAVVGKAVASRPTLPVLSHVLFEAEGTKIRFGATDLELYILATTGGKAQEDGSITLPARLFTDLISSFPNERIDLDLAGSTLHLECGSNTAKVRGIDADQFPIVPDVSDDTQLYLPVEKLIRMLSRTIIAVATDENRPILTGVYARFEDDTLTTAAADGFRLSVCKEKLGTSVKAPIVIIIPRRAIEEVIRLAKSEKNNIEMKADHSRVQFSLEGNDNAYGIDLISQLIEGNFPDYTQIVPKSHTTRTVVNRRDLLKACKTAQIFARNEANIVEFDIDDVGQQITVVSSSTQSGNGESQIEATIAGDSLKIAFNVRYIIECLNVTDSTNVIIETSSPARPIAIKPDGDEDSFIHVIMPMHIRREDALKQ